MKESLGKKEKLKSKKLIEALFSDGISVKKYPVKLVYLPITSEETNFKTGFSVPKKLVKTAVKRNRLKRLMREAFRKNKYLVVNELKQPYAFMFIYISKEEISQEVMTDCIIQILRKFSEKERHHEKASH